MPDATRSEDPVRTVPVREGYDLWAEVYDSDGNPHMLDREEGELYVTYDPNPRAST